MADEPQVEPATGWQLVTLARNMARNGLRVKLGFLNVPVSQAEALSDRFGNYDLLEAITEMMADGWRVSQHVGESWYLQRACEPAKGDFLLSSLKNEFAKRRDFSFMVSSPEPGKIVYTITFTE